MMPLFPKKLELWMTSGRLWVMKPCQDQFACRIGKLLSDDPLISSTSTDDLLPGQIEEG